jgi:hypothetical protein
VLKFLAAGQGGLLRVLAAKEQDPSSSSMQDSTGCQHQHNADCEIRWVSGEEPASSTSNFFLARGRREGSESQAHSGNSAKTLVTNGLMASALS